MATYINYLDDTICSDYQMYTTGTYGGCIYTMPANAKTVTSVAFVCRKNGTGDANIKLEIHANNKDGTKLAEVTSWSNSGNYIRTFTLSSALNVTGGNSYFFGVYYNGVTFPNYYAIETNYTSPLLGIYYNNSNGDKYVSNENPQIGIFGDLYTGPANVKLCDGLAQASLKSNNGLAFSSAKNINGLA